MTAATEVRFAAAEALDAELGDPTDPENRCGFAATVARAEMDVFPEVLAEVAGRALRLSYVPSAAGGDLTGYDETFALIRVAARRDPAVMPATMIDITATLCVLLSGSDAQRAFVVDLLRRGGSIGFAFSEPEHGSDLLANTCALTETDDGWRLDGGKWLVGFGRRPEALLVIAHTGGRGPAAFSTVLVEDPLGTYPAVPRPESAETAARRQRVAGMRGISFYELDFDSLRLPGDALVGQRGRGMETAMRAMQVVRATSAAANLAAADSALRLTMDFAHGHVVADRPVDAHPAGRREIGTAAAALIACDAAALACVRGLHTLPGTQSLWSGTVKAVLTGLSEELFARCADVLGSRSVLREGPAGAFDVLRADNAAVRYFDTSPTANLRLISMQLRGVVERDDTGVDLETVAATFDLDRDLPPLDLGGLALFARGRDIVTGALDSVRDEVRAALGARADGDTLELLTLAAIDRLYDELRSAADEHARIATLPPARRTTPQLDLAARVSHLHAAASCVLLWWFNRHRSLYGCAPGSVEWLVPALTLLLDRSVEHSRALPESVADSAFHTASRLHRDGLLFSAVPIRLAGPRPADTSTRPAASARADEQR